MKYMGWSYQDLMSLPYGYYPVLVEIIKEEAAKIKEIHDGRKN